MYFCPATCLAAALLHFETSEFLLPDGDHARDPHPVGERRTCTECRHFFCLEKYISETCSFFSFSRGKEGNLITGLGPQTFDNTYAIWTWNFRRNSSPLVGCAYWLCPRLCTPFCALWAMLLVFVLAPSLCTFLPSCICACVDSSLCVRPSLFLSHMRPVDMFLACFRRSSEHVCIPLSVCQHPPPHMPLYAHSLAADCLDFLCLRSPESRLPGAVSAPVCRTTPLPALLLSSFLDSGLESARRMLQATVDSIQGAALDPRGLGRPSSVHAGPMKEHRQ